MKDLNDALIDSSRLPVTWGNRATSLACIGLVWLVVRLVSELSGTGWERAFWHMSVLLGAYPAVLSLVLAAFSKNCRDQTRHRCMSFWIIPLSLLASLVLGGDKPLSGQGTTLIDYMLSLGLQFSILLVIHLLFHSKFHKGV